MKLDFSQHSQMLSRLKIAFAIALSVALLELIGGVLSNSLALLSDAAHVFIDALSLGIALFAIKIAAKPHTPSLTYGYHRVEILAAFVNGATLIGVSAFIFYEAYRRFLEPPQVSSDLMIIFASIGLIANLVMVKILAKHSNESLNVRGAFLHVIGDALASVGVIAGGVAIAFTSLNIIDLLVGVFIGAIILRSAIKICKDCTRIFLEGTPKEVDIMEVKSEIEGVEGVKEVHDLHVWTITSGMDALSGHIVVKDQMLSQSQVILSRLNDMLKEKFGLYHSTLQLENQNDLIQPKKLSDENDNSA
ncbi:MAG: cation diffusion facilitator family transporter [Nitrososphaerales archaeon]